MSTDTRLTPLVASLPATVPFVGPEAQERARGRPFAARLGANESVFGPSPNAIRAMQEAAAETWMYGDPEAHDLRHAIAAPHGVGADNIMLGEGIDGLLGLTVRLFMRPGDCAVTSAGAYPTFNYHVAGFGGTLHTVPYVKDCEDPASLLAKAAEVDAKLIYIANPDNPMGTWHDAAAMQAMIDAVPETSMLILDEAYVDLAPEGTAPDIDTTNPNVLRFRTFSKAHGLAGLRVGYVIGQADVIAVYDRVRNHFGLGRVAQAGALAAIQDEEWLAHITKTVARGREAIAQIARDNGLATLPSATNFVTVDCGADGAFARAVLAHLIEAGVFIRMPGIAPQDRCIRIGVGSDGDHAALAAALPTALAKTREDHGGQSG